MVLSCLTADEFGGSQVPWLLDSVAAYGKFGSCWVRGC